MATGDRSGRAVGTEEWSVKGKSDDVPPSSANLSRSITQSAGMSPSDDQEREKPFGEGDRLDLSLASFMNH